MTREILHSSKSNEWYTPAKYIEAAREVMGGIDLDPASSEEANKTVQARTFFTEALDGLLQPWSGRVFLNPPYGKSSSGVSNQAVWSKKLLSEFQMKCTIEAILLVNAVPGNAWFQPLWDFPICFTDHRIRFISPEGQRDQPTHGNVFVYISTPDRRQRFAEVFSQFGPVVDPDGVRRRAG